MKNEGDRLDVYVGVAPEEGLDIPDPTEDLIPELRSFGQHTRRWHEQRDWAEWDAEHPYIPVGAGAHTPISESEARGNSRAVSAGEFQKLASDGQQRLAALQS